MTVPFLFIAYLAYTVFTLILVVESIQLDPLKVWHVFFIASNVLLLIFFVIVLLIEFVLYVNRNYVPQKVKDFLNKEIHCGDV